MAPTPSSTVGSRPPAPPGLPSARPAPTIVPGARRQRRWSLALLAILVTLGSALAFMVLWMNAGGRHPVLVVRQPVAAGQIIADDDLTVVALSTDPGIKPLASSLRDDVVGKPATVDLLPGSVLVAGAVGEAEGLRSGTAIVAIPIPSDEFPTLETGDRVLIYQTSDDSGGEGPDSDVIGDGRVFQVSVDEDAGSDVRVSVNVDESLVPKIAAAIHADRIYIARASAGG